MVELIGAPIPGSKYVRAYCWNCLEPLRVFPGSIFAADGSELPQYCARCRGRCRIARHVSRPPNVRSAPVTNRQISYKAAIRLVRGEYGRVDFSHVWKLLQDGEAILLDSGAKLFKRKRKYFIGGYAADNSDVTCYAA